MLRAKIMWVCPYCGVDNGQIIEVGTVVGEEDRVTYCDPDEGGCGKKVLVTTGVKITATTYRIEPA